MSYRGRASYNRAPNCASRNTKPYIVTYMPVYFVMCIERAESPEGDYIF